MPKTYSLLKVEDTDVDGKPVTDNDIDFHKKQVFQKVHIKNKSTSENALLLTTKNDNTASGPIVTFDRDSANPARGDILGKIQFKGRLESGDTIRYGSINAKIKSAGGDDTSALEFIVRVGGQHKTMLVVQNDGVIVHVDKPLMLQASGYKKTRLFGTNATKRRDIYFPDQAGTVMVNESGKVMATDLPTSDPSNAGQLWNDGGTVKISSG
tara:strand:+ start:174 stop:806 length:633 start_codon:yes stop_codon:yes gene_type:complete